MEVISRAQELLSARNRSVSDSRILVVGVSRTHNAACDGSFGLQIIRSLIECGADVAYYDPTLPVLGPIGLNGSSWQLRSMPLSEVVVDFADLVVIAGDCDAAAAELVRARARLSLDVRGWKHAFQDIPQPATPPSSWTARGRYGWSAIWKR